MRSSAAKRARFLPYLGKVPTPFGQGLLKKPTPCPTFSVISALHSPQTQFFHFSPGKVPHKKRDLAQTPPRPCPIPSKSFLPGTLSCHPERPLLSFRAASPVIPSAAKESPAVISTKAAGRVEKSPSPPAASYAFAPPSPLQAPARPPHLQMRSSAADIFPGSLGDSGKKHTFASVMDNLPPRRSWAYS